MKKEMKKIGLSLIISILTIVSISSVVYAKFTRQYHPEVNDFSISVSSQKNMMISTSANPGTFTDSIRLSDIVENTNINLLPSKGKVITTEDGMYKKLTIDDSNVIASNNRDYFAFDLYFMGSDDMNLYLAGNASDVVANFYASNSDPSFTEAQRIELLSRLRIGFLTYATTYSQSASGLVFTPSENPIDCNIYANGVTTNPNYETFNKLKYSDSVNDVILATTKAGEITKIRVVIWLEEEGLELTGLQAFLPICQEYE